MITKLKKIFPSLVCQPSTYDQLSSKYEWFLTDENKIIGIHKNDLTNEHMAILLAFLQPLNLKVPIPTEEELKWKKLIHNNEASPSIKLNNDFRFVFFSINNLELEPKLFYDAIQDVFARQVPIIWNNEREGIIIEKQSNLDDLVSYKEIIDILMSDLYVKIKFFIGPLHSDLINVHESYQNLANTAKIVFQNSNKSVMTYIDSLPYLLLNQIGSNFRLTLSTSILKQMIDDEEMLQTIEALFENNLNVTETAKKMYMHRNSLQYRIDKFIDQTGINIQQFDQALVVYLAILAKRHSL